MTRILAALAATTLVLGGAPVLAAEAGAADPARIAAARETVDHVFPLGTYARIMNETMDKLMDSMMNSMTALPVRDLAGISGVDTSKLGEGTLAEIMEIYDPAYQERMKRATRSMMAEMTTLMTEFEPEIRDGLSQAYAARFDTTQLGELNSFFATPTGGAYAADSYLIMMSPEVMAKMQAFMPKMMQQMPAMIAKVKAATDDLPQPRKYADLSKAERNKLAELLGISEAELEKQKSARGGEED